MVWQDTAFFIGTWIFIISLIPMLRSKEKPPLKTSIPTSLTVYAFVYVHATLGLWLTAFVTFLIAIVWTILAIQKYKQK